MPIKTQYKNKKYSYYSLSLEKKGALSMAQRMKEKCLSYLKW